MNKKIKGKRDHSRAAVDVVSDLAPLADGKPGLPEPDPATPTEGKPGLPEPEAEPENGLEPYEEDAEGEDEQEDQEEVTFTEKDRRDLPLLEKRVEGKLREAAEAIREIRQRQLWRLCEDDHGQRVNYPNFEAYCQDHLGHSRQWVTHLTNWLRITEELDSLKISVPHLTVKAAQGLLIGRLQDAGGLRAVLDEAKEDGVPLDRDHLREIVIRRANFNYWSKDETEGVNKPAATAYADYKKDLAAVGELADGKTSWAVVKRAKALDGDLADNLVALCQQEGVMPKAEALLSVLTGEALMAVVGRLKDMALEQAEIAEKKNRLKGINKQLREGQRKERDEKKALEQELEAKGVALKPKPKPPQDESPPPPSTAPQDNEANEETETEPDSDVYMGFQTAWETLDEALSGEWPLEDGELNAILLKSQECETKLAKITAKVKELLADTQEPEAVPSGNA